MAIILPNLEWQWYFCLCWAYHTHYVCRCYGCAEENELDVKWNLIKSNK
jgi:hypothetical protein